MSLCLGLLPPPSWGGDQSCPFGRSMIDMLPHPHMHMNVEIKFDDDISLDSFEKV